MSYRLFTLSALTLALLSAAAQAQATGQADDSTQLDTVTVQSSADASASGLSRPHAGGQVAEGGQVGLLGTQAMMDTPFSFIDYTELLIKDQQAASVGEVLLNDPAVRVARGFGNYQQVYLVRGLPVFSDDMTYNGLYGLLPRQYLASEFIERVQVLRGANTFLKGAAPGGSGLGGAVNVVPKRAPNEDMNQVTLGAQTGVQGHAATDLARRSEDGRYGIRINAARRDGDSAIDGESSELSMAHIGVDFRDEALRVSADLGFQDHRIDGGQPNITIDGPLPIPRTPDATTSIGQSWTFSDARDLFGTLRTEYDFRDNVTGWAAFGARTSEEAGVFANPTVNAANGDYTARRFDNTREDTVLTGEAGLRVGFNTGDISHRVSVSAASFELQSKNAFALSAAGSVTGNIYAPADVPPPVPNAFPTGGDLNNPLTTIKTRVHSLALVDQMSLLNERLLITLGARYQQLNDDSYASDTGARLASASYDDSAITPSVGVLYKLTPSLSAYANYIEGLQKGQRAPATTPGGDTVANAGEALAPYRTKQTEIGLKFERDTLGGSVSLYRSRKPIAALDGNDVFAVQDHQENGGLELMAYGLLTPDLSVLGGVSYLDADVSGNTAIGSPRTQANFNMEYRLPQFMDLALDGRVIHTSTQFADAANQQQLDAWTRLDLGARYTLPVGDAALLTLRGRLENVTGEDYWASAGGFPDAGYLTVGAPRTWLLSATLDF
ncbi:TonB-dependent receptor [Alcanivorax sp. JB21]|uniref:TonB-dependent receptor n=1 Tax=Alcanivorax limicola TaxID=2874102 RepID=UPI001CBC6ACF|nr:TonB-dependent receptor [Alcanivorax limicola]MBZ2189404.1 TonB-dependent receptor [Alcanivorax limicola]